MHGELLRIFSLPLLSNEQTMDGKRQKTDNERTEDSSSSSSACLYSLQLSHPFRAQQYTCRPEYQNLKTNLMLMMCNMSMWNVRTLVRVAKCMNSPTSSNDVRNILVLAEVDCPPKFEDRRSKTFVTLR